MKFASLNQLKGKGHSIKYFFPIESQNNSISFIYRRIQVNYGGSQLHRIKEYNEMLQHYLKTLSKIGI